MILTSEYILETFQDGNSFKFTFLSKLAESKNSLNFSFTPKIKRFLIKKIVRSLNKDLTKLLVILEGISTVLGKEDVQITKKSYFEFEKLLSKYTKLYFVLTEQNFFSNTDLNELSDKVFFEFFDLESKLKLSAFETTICHQDGELLNEAAQISLLTASSYEPSSTSV